MMKLVFAMRVSQAFQKFKKRAGKEKHCHHAYAFIHPLSTVGTVDSYVHSIYQFPLQSMLFLLTHDHHSPLNISFINFIGRNKQ